MNKIAIMQPYFLPYLGYFQLMNNVDIFVVYNNIEFTKKGFINRNRILNNSKASWISLPLKKDSDYLNINQRYISDSYTKDKIKILNKIKNSYCKAPFFDEVFELVCEILDNKEGNLFSFIFNSLSKIKEYLNLDCELIISEDVPINHNLKGKSKVIEIVKALEGGIYVNSLGGKELYSKEEFKNNGIKLNFLETKPNIYNQFNSSFIPNLSIIDVLMFNNQDAVKFMLNEFNEI